MTGHASQHGGGGPHVMCYGLGIVPGYYHNSIVLLVLFHLLGKQATRDEIVIGLEAKVDIRPWPP
jgi:hypothetical protein